MLLPKNRAGFRIMVVSGQGAPMCLGKVAEISGYNNRAVWKIGSFHDWYTYVSGQSGRCICIIEHGCLGNRVISGLGRFRTA